MTDNQSRGQARGQTRGRRQLLMLAGVFLGPVVFAFVVYYGFDWRPAGATQHGELLQPPVLLPDVALIVASGVDESGVVESGAAENQVAPRLRRKWSLIVVAEDGCPAACQASLYETRQVRKALSRERDRTQRVLLIGGEFDRATLEQQHPDLIIVTTDSPVAGELAATTGALDMSFIYLADPLGNLMMRFPRDTGMKGIHTDLKKLLKLSRIG
ncbi:MAG: hypothetical protein ACR2QV_17245 [Gammaproteobacteria bacterium]